MSGSTERVGILTSGGLAPCLSSAVAGLILKYTEVRPDIPIICYLNGYRGLLLGDSTIVTQATREQAIILQRHGGSPIGNSRVKLVNVDDCVKRGLVQPGQHPQKVAAEQLIKDKITILHTIGGDDTNTEACKLAHYLKDNYGNYKCTVVGLPKTIDNDVFPIKQTLGCITAAEQGSKFFTNVVAEHSASPRMLLIHEIMGRHCGWLAARTARFYRESLEKKEQLIEFGVNKDRLDVHALFIPEMAIDIPEEVERLRTVMDNNGTVNIFLSEGAGIADIVKQKQRDGEKIERDAFGHLKLDLVKPGAWFGKQFAKMLGAEKVLVQKSGYFCRAAPSNEEDLDLISKCVDVAVDAALSGKSGVPGHDIEKNDELCLIDFDRIKGGKHFDTNSDWFLKMLEGIGQTHRGAPKPPKDDEVPKALKEPLKSKDEEKGRERPKLKNRPKQLLREITPAFSESGEHLLAPQSQDQSVGMRHRASLVTVNNALRTYSAHEVASINELLKTRYDDVGTLGKLSSVLSGLFLACKDISNECNKTGVFESIYGDRSHGDQTSAGKRLNFMANEIIMNALRHTNEISAIISQENDTPIIFENAKSAQFCCVTDPLDGVQNIDANVSVGTIFGIYRASPVNPTDPKNVRHDLLRKASDLLLAGYCMYGAATILVVTAGQDSGVHGFTLDNSRHEFVLSHPNIKIPKTGRIYSVNEGNYDDWDVASREYVRRCKLLKKGKRQSMRYIGSMTSDVHRTLTYGGIFMYPADRRNRSGKLGLLYECGPMAYVICAAGGKATTGTRNIMDITAESFHQSTPVILGSPDPVTEVEELYVELDPDMHQV